jgi:hypothetical protein
MSSMPAEPVPAPTSVASRPHSAQIQEDDGDAPHDDACGGTRWPAAAAMACEPFPAFPVTMRRYRRCLVIPDLEHDMQDAGFDRRAGERVTGRSESGIAGGRPATASTAATTVLLSWLSCDGAVIGVAAVVR